MRIFPSFKTTSVFDYEAFDTYYPEIWGVENSGDFEKGFGPGYSHSSGGYGDGVGCNVNNGYYPIALIQYWT